MSDSPAQARLPGKPVAIVDIGSNSVRLVAYESHCRAPTPTFNERALCGLGRGVATSGLLPEDGVAKALAALQRFRVLCDIMRISDVRSVATAAVRDAANGPQFLSLAERAIGCEIELLSGQREARLSALGVASSIHNADGIVGDLGGGSLELTEIRSGDAGAGITLPLGSLSLMDLSERSPKKAAKIVRETLSNVKLLQSLPGRTFYAVGGTWRALARLHMRQRQYPMNVMHNYVIPSRDALEFARLVERIEAEALIAIEAVSSARRPLLAYGAAVIEEVIRQANPKEIVVSALGVREGLLYSQLPSETQAEDPLIVAAWEFNRLRSRAPAHGEELFDWTSRLIATTHLEEEEEDRRLRHAACLLSDISWRAHPDYRGAQAYDLVANSAFIGVDHPSRAFLALAAAYRHLSNEDFVTPQSRALVNARQLDRARIIGAAMRVAYNISAAMPGVLPRAPMICEKGRVVLTLPAALASLSSERLQSRMRQFARLIGGDPEIRAAL
ncbi:MAG TPA: exopolyphosphatase [Roseiarcus sp.]|jgi:exopolyphosphatase/guanosine-5'-triphosphate,3'-diphosphate pyrophosphatase|nr:exopolyphosphatase [Roseiarcus sp.]